MFIVKFKKNTEDKNNEDIRNQHLCIIDIIYLVFIELQMMNLL